MIDKILLENLSLETERLIIRPVIKEDEAMFFEFLSDRDSCYSDGGYEPITDYYKFKELFDKELINDYTRVIFADKTSNELIGFIHLMDFFDDIEIGYSVVPLKRKQGYCYEALISFINYLFQECHVKKLCIGTTDKNIASNKIAKKLGFVESGREKEEFFDAWDNKYVDIIDYYLENPDKQ